MLECAANGVLVNGLAQISMYLNRTTCYDIQSFPYLYVICRPLQEEVLILAMQH
jgi:hypothetical protein